MSHNKEAKSLTFWRGSEVSQVKVRLKRVSLKSLFVMVNIYTVAILYTRITPVPNLKP